ncbi:hypothetical protein ACQKGO_09575 [Corallococcus interemptor]|uniref:hypothetical protein n=1 Tax=Corallococcus interemptor TaxID=2316720 RepID=UPI003D01B310
MLYIVLGVAFLGLGIFATLVENDVLWLSPGVFPPGGPPRIRRSAALLAVLVP